MKFLEELELEIDREDLGGEIDSGFMPADDLGNQWVGMHSFEKESLRQVSIEFVFFVFRLPVTGRSDPTPLRRDGTGLDDYSLEVTFRYMMWRRLERLRTGTIGKPSLYRLVLVAIVFGLFVIMVGVYGRRFYNFMPWESLAIGVVAIPLVFVLAVSVSLMVKISFYTVAAGTAALVIVAAVAPLIDDPITGQKVPSPAYDLACTIVVWVVVGVVVAMMLIHVVYMYWWPWWVIHGYGNTVKNWTVRKVANQRGVFTYKAWEPAKHRTMRNLVLYRGQCDPQGRPHGFGEWRDDSTAGECLKGYWAQGLPVGPFRSRESGTGNAFSAIRVGFARNVAGTWQQIRWLPQRGNGLEWGFGVAECSVAGAFYSKLPETKLIVQPTTKADDPDIVDKIIDGLALGTDPNVIDKTEDCIIFCHGYNASAESAFVTFAQLLTIGDFPKRFRPFIFSWPAGGPITYINARTMIESKDCQSDYIQMIKDLTAAGFNRFHLLGHSMGARMPAAITYAFHELFQPLAVSDLAKGGPKLQPNGQPLPELATLTFLNGECHFHDFRDHHYPIMRQYTDLITVYSDDNDEPLGLAEFFGNIVPAESITGKPYSALGRHGRELYVEDPKVTVPGPKGVPRPLRQYLDVDVLDTTFLQTNVQGMRHTFFGINR